MENQGMTVDEVIGNGIHLFDESDGKKFKPKVWKVYGDSGKSTTYLSYSKLY